MDEDVTEDALPLLPRFIIIMARNVPLKLKKS